MSIQKINWEIRYILSNLISISLLCKGQNKGTRKENCHGNYIPSGEGLSAAELTSTADASNGQVRPPAFAVSERVYEDDDVDFIADDEDNEPV